MAARPDPNTDERRENFIKFCADHGWRDESGKWALSAIAKYFGRQPNQVNNILYGHGSFGPSVARSMALFAKLPTNTFEPGSAKLSKDAYQLAQTFDMIPESDQERRNQAFADALRTLLKHVHTDPARGQADA